MHQESAHGEGRSAESYGAVDVGYLVDKDAGRRFVMEKGGLKSPGSIAFTLLIMWVLELFGKRNEEFRKVLRLLRGEDAAFVARRFSDETSRWGKAGCLRRTKCVAIKYVNFNERWVSFGVHSI